jgi:hypothetical protein
VETDVIRTQQSAIKRDIQSTPGVAKMADLETSVENEIALVAESKSTEEFIDDEDLSEIENDDELTALPWDDIDEGWKSQLKEYLVSVDPEKGEEMFQAYLEEKKRYVERVDFTENGESVSEDLNNEAVVETDAKEGELERIHQQNLKDIFGDHMTQVEALHKEYVESIQYLNRTSAKFSVTL